ncbi:MAG: preprotein translocase subunit YajC [Chitinophagales bacterium]|jgi:preprotein translocase subunit YajC|tara:strand:- start:6672 stop:6998 length:327 start_codon:yes stop_codon:yes gene_type:complete
MNYIILASEGGGFFADPMNMVLISAAMFVLYFFMLRPNQKKAKQAEAFMEGLEKGTKVVTASGIHGKVNRINEGTIDMEIGKNTIIKVEKNAISIEMSTALNKPAEEK